MIAPDYDFVISYASEDRNSADELYRHLANSGARVFYAPEKQAELWGENLYEHLSDIYSRKAIFCIPLVSEHYVNKQWTRHEWRSAQERALAEVNRAYVLPIRLDDTELPGLLNTIAYQDARNISLESIAKLALDKLSLEKQGAEISKESASTISAEAIWNYERLAFQRSSFLNENNYLNPNSDTFALNAFTTRLLKHDDSEPDGILTLIAVPVPETLTVDLDELAEALNLRQSGVIGDGPNQCRFSTANYHIEFTNRANYTIGYPSSRQYSDGQFRSPKYLRLCEDGGIELGVGRYVTRTSREDVRYFNFINILGTSWKFLHLAINVYHRLGYQAKIQILVNLTQVKGSSLAEFATEKNGISRWPSALSSDLDAAIFFESGRGIASDKNLQFVFTIDVNRVIQEPSQTESIIVALSRKLQRSFNFAYEPRHYLRDTSEFPWHQYHWME